VDRHLSRVDPQETITSGRFRGVDLLQSRVYVYLGPSRGYCDGGSFWIRRQPWVETLEAHDGNLLTAALTQDIQHVLNSRTRLAMEVLL
jgi:hypothetical protein